MKNNTHMGDKNILFIEFLNKKHKLFKHEQQETHLDTKNEKTNTLSWIFRVWVYFNICLIMLTALTNLDTSQVLKNYSFFNATAKMLCNS
jgi:hypothetical protein